ncbi:uncharacterized protein [Onthophagus taurus]|uniref:uncharacterized protein n=1 Tax=Onthophagus taurus TaxID=166361 RepID=UPI0039BE04DC
MPDETILQLWVDGSRRETGSGASVYSVEPTIKVSKPLEIWPTALQAELVAISLAAEEISNKISNKKIIIYCDCKQALLSLGRYRCSSSLLEDCHNNLCEAAASNEITICWTKGHSGNKLYDMEDNLARKSAGEPPRSPEPFIAPTIRSLIELRKEETRKQFLTYWDRTPGCREAKEALMYPDPKRTDLFMRLSRKNLRLVIGLIISHWHLQKHLLNMGISNTDICRGCGEEEESAEHILCDCVALQTLRLSIFGDIQIRMSGIRAAQPGQI